MPRREDTEEKVPMVIEMFTEGVGPRDISAETGLSEQTVRSILRQAGFDPSRVGSRKMIDQMSEPELNQMVEEYQAGEAVSTLCTRYHMSTGTLYNILAELGITPRDKTSIALKSRQMQFDEAVKMYQDGWVLWFIKEETGIAPPRLMELLHKRGIPKRGRGTSGKTPLLDPVTGRYVMKLEGGELVTGMQ